MPQAGFTPIQTYNSPTAGHIPVNTNLYAGELAINTTDEKLYFKNTGGTVKLLASTAVFTTTGSGSYVLATTPTFVNGININSIYVGDGTGATYGNTIVGAGAMYHARTLGATEWDDNLAAGANALHFITEGTGNVAIGSRALYTLSTGNYNVAVGHHALYYANNVSYFTNLNTAIGAFAGRDVTTGTFNIFIGSSSGLEVTTGDSNVIIGGDYGTDIKTLYGHIILSDGVGNRRLHYDAGNVLWNFGSAHVTLEGVTSTGATGTGKFVFDSAPTITGHPTIEGVTSTGATGTGKFVFDSAPTITGHPTIEGVTSTGATGTGKFVFDSSPTLSGVTLSDGTVNGVVYLNSSKVLTSGSGLAFDGTNLGVGTSSPTALSGFTSVTVNANGGGNPLLDLQKSGALQARLTGATNALDVTANVITFSTGSISGGTITERMRIDSSGNLGLGVVPSAWNTLKAMQISNAGFAGTSTQTFITANAFYQTGWKYMGTAEAVMYQQDSTHKWFTAPSGTAGNTISFTQAMTLDASGNLLVGTTTNTFNSRAIFSTTGTYPNLVVTGDYNTPLISFNGGPYIRSDGSYFFLTTTATSGDRAIYMVAQSAGVYLAANATSWTANSDERLKTDLTPILDAAKKVSSLRTVTGRYITDSKNKRRSFLIAQDVQLVLPEAVTVSEQVGHEGELGVQYTDVIPLLAAAIQELTARIEKLENKL